MSRASFCFDKLKDHMIAFLMVPVETLQKPIFFLLVVIRPRVTTRFQVTWLIPIVSTPFPVIFLSFKFSLVLCLLEVFCSYLTNKKQIFNLSSWWKLYSSLKKTASFYWLQQKNEHSLFISIYEQYQFPDILLPWELHSLVFDQYYF